MSQEEKKSQSLDASAAALFAGFTIFSPMAGRFFSEIQFFRLT
jgi:hypothetical protein